MRVRSLLMFVALVGAVAACEDDDVVAEYTATLSDDNERNPLVTNAPNASGTFSAELDEDRIIRYTITYTGLTANATLAHIHGPATTEQSAGVIIDFNRPAEGRTITLGTSGTATGIIDLNLPTNNANVSADSLLVLLNNGRAYVNIHTSTNPPGEIRGQIVRQ